MFNRLFEKLNEQFGEEEYSADVKAVVHITGLRAGEETRIVDFGKGLALSYNIYIEYRSWGIKDIAVVPRGKVEFEVEILDAEDSVVRNLPVVIDFDTDSYSIEWIKSNVYMPEQIEVFLTDEGKIDEIILLFKYIDKNESTS